VLRNQFGNFIINIMVTDTVADFLARMQNAITRKKENVEIPQAKMLTVIVEILKEEKMITGYEIVDGKINIVLAYNEGEPVVSKFTKISKPGQRIYVSYSEILPVMNGRGISIVSTSKGVMTGARAKNQKLGGELICEIW
jgi:small subunit ribosomal protein S8